jgi:putative phage-type endonuclease
MIARKDIIQGTHEWHECRWGKIGGSIAKGLFIKSDTLMLDVLAEYSEQYQFSDSYSSPAMERGNELEPEARYALEQYTGITFHSVGWLQSVDIPLLGISPDGLTEDETIACELKCPSSKKHIVTCLEDEIPLDYIHQCVHYFTVNPKLEKLYFVSYRPEAIKPLFVKILLRTDSVNLGTKSKPVIKTVQEWVEIAKAEAIEINKQINEAINKLSF